MSSTSTASGLNLLQRKGSLLISPINERGLEQNFKRIEQAPEMEGLKLIPDASKYNRLLQPNMSYGLHYPNDYTCSPVRIIEDLKQRFHLQTERRIPFYQDAPIYPSFSPNQFSLF